MTERHDPRTPNDACPGELGAILARAERALMAGAIVRVMGPPAEVRREMLIAQRAGRDLAARGREVRFEALADGHVSIALTDRAGRAVAGIAPAGLFRLLKLAG
jgi:hypothetical protein